MIARNVPFATSEWSGMVNRRCGGPAAAESCGYRVADPTRTRSYREPWLLRDPIRLARYSGCYLHDLFGDGRWNRLTMRLQTLQIPGDRFLDIVNGFGTRFPLRNATRKRRSFGDVNAVFILLNKDTILHGTNLSISSLITSGANRPQVENITGFRRMRLYNGSLCLVQSTGAAFSRAIRRVPAASTHWSWGRSRDGLCSRRSLFRQRRCRAVSRENGRSCRSSRSPG